MRVTQYLQRTKQLVIDIPRCTTRLMPVDVTTGAVARQYISRVETVLIRPRGPWEECAPSTIDAILKSPLTGDRVNDPRGVIRDQLCLISMISGHWEKVILENPGP